MAELFISNLLTWIPTGQSGRHQKSKVYYGCYVFLFTFWLHKQPSFHKSPSCQQVNYPLSSKKLNNKQTNKQTVTGKTSSVIFISYMLVYCISCIFICLNCIVAKKSSLYKRFWMVINGERYILCTWPLTKKKSMLCIHA